MAANESRHFTPACGVAYQCYSLQVERINQSGKIIGVCIQVVAGPALVRPPMTAPIMRDHAIALLPKEEHLRVPRIRAQGPSMRENNWLASTPILIVDFRSVLGDDRIHARASLVAINSGL